MGPARRRSLPPAHARRRARRREAREHHAAPPAADLDARGRGATSTARATGVHLKLCDFGFASLWRRDGGADAAHQPTSRCPCKWPPTPTAVTTGSQSTCGRSAVPPEMMHGRMAFPSSTSFELEAAVRWAPLASGLGRLRQIRSPKASPRLVPEQRLTAKELVARRRVQAEPGRRSRWARRRRGSGGAG